MKSEADPLNKKTKVNNLIFYQFSILGRKSQVKREDIPIKMEDDGRQSTFFRKTSSRKFDRSETQDRATSRAKPRSIPKIDAK